MKHILIYIFVIGSLLFIPKPVGAVSYPRAKVCGEVKKVDIGKRQIHFYSYKNGEVLTLNVGDLTSFVKDGQKSEFDFVKEGIVGEIIYKSPLFTERYVVILRWVTDGELDSETCRRFRKKE